MRTLLALSTALLLAVPVQAAAPTEVQKAEFYDVCVAVSKGNTELCRCKTDAAPGLVDENFMAMVIGAMKGGPVPKSDHAAYNAYVAKSNQICLPGY